MGKSPYSDLYNKEENMYRNTYRGRARGARSMRARGARSMGPYQQRTTNTTPRATPESLLTGSSQKERALAKARDDLRVANEWQAHFRRYFEEEGFNIPRPSNCHRIPEAETLLSTIDGILAETRTKCKEAVQTHVQGLIDKAEENIKNPPETAQQSLLSDMAKLLHTQQKESMQAMISAMAMTFKDVLKQSQNKE